ncbi:alginate lyase family protein [Rhodanobacter sp. DHB23]|uniref:alginate lyase family protein n=1 Tax=Rhodanobacter sp. DHB23 TaxID=2775923 RepID=UPI0017872B1A|nr:alginate lyase family protein [Rhodanobacter sp. DHB23]MBD8872932.1 alginate lyase family protein [Rhodanobacter sp. DHB23]
MNTRQLLPAALLTLACATTQATDAPRWWCPLATPSPAHANDAVVTDALAHLHDQPQPMAHLHTQGLLPHQGIHDASTAAERDWPLALRAAVAWRLSGKPELLQQVTRYLDAWATTYQPDFNPIDETNLAELFQAYVLTRDALPASTRDAMAVLIRRIAEGYLTRLRAKVGSTYINDINNWQSHRIKLLAISAAALGDPQLVEAARERLMLQVAANIRPDGSTVDFAQRDALHYVTYDLEPLVQAALALSPYGKDNLLEARSATGSSLAAALDWLAPWAKGQRTHQEFVHTSEPFDVERQKAGLKGYGGTWDPRNSSALYAQAAVLLPKYRALAEQLGDAPPVLQACAPSPERK